MTTALSGIVQDLDDWHCLKDFSTLLRQSQHISDTMVICEAMEAVRSLSPCKLQLNILINYCYFKISFGKRKKKLKIILSVLVFDLGTNHLPSVIKHL